MKRNRPTVKVAPRKYDTKGLPDRFFNPGELDVLLHLMESVGAHTVVEFGVNTGRNPAAAFRNLPSVERYIGIDVEPGYECVMPVQRRDVPQRAGELVAGDPRFELIVKRRGSFDLTPADLPECDVAFIDADHSTLGVLNDYRLAKAVGRQGGLIIFHDDNCRPVVQVTETLNHLCDSGAQIVHIDGTWLSYEVVP